MPTTSRPSTRKPGSMFAAWRIDRASSSAQTSRSTESATCATTKTDRARSRGALPARSRLSVVASCGRVAVHAGTTPHSRPVTVASANANTTTRQSSAPVQPDVHVGHDGNRANQRRGAEPRQGDADDGAGERNHQALDHEQADDAARAAPSASRTPSSGARVTPLASSNPAVVKHAMSITRPTRANRRPTKRFTIGAAVDGHGAGALDAQRRDRGCRRETRARRSLAMRAIWSRACSMPTPGFSRPMPISHCRPRSATRREVVAVRVRRDWDPQPLLLEAVAGEAPDSRRR